MFYCICMRFSSNFIQKLYRTGFLLVIILALVDLLVFFFYPGTIFYDIFLATREQTPLTWFSSLAMFFIAMSCLSVYFDSKDKIWYFLAITFFFFSMDDAIYFHERLSGFFVDNTSFFSFFPSYTWVVIYFPLLIFSLGALLYLLWRDVAHENKRLVILALAGLGVAIFLDLVDGFVGKDPGLVFCLKESCDLAFTHLIRLTEEVLEVLALGLLGYVNIRRHCLID